MVCGCLGDGFGVGVFGCVFVVLLAVYGCFDGLAYGLRLLCLFYCCVFLLLIVLFLFFNFYLFVLL